MAIANSVVDHVCRESGPFDQVDGVISASHAEMLAALAQVNPDVVAEQIGRSLDCLDDPRLLVGDVNRHLARALSTIAFRFGTFAVGARLLLRLSVTDDTSVESDASRQFVELFSPLLGGTEADGNARLLFLDEAADTSDRTQLEHVVEALSAGCTLGGYERMIGPEIQGSRRALDPWYPISKQEWFEYIVGCVTRLGKLAGRNDDVGVKARSDLGLSLSSLVLGGFLEAVEKAIQRVVGAGFSWTMALRQLKAVLVDDSRLIDDETSSRVRSLVEKLEPTSLRERVRVFVTEPPMAGFMEEELSILEQIERHRAIVQALADELLADSPTLREILPELCRGRQTMAAELGESLAKCAPSPITWLEPIVQALNLVPESDRDYDFLSGFISGLAVRFRDEAEAFKMRAIASPELAPAVPMICKRAGLTSADVGRAIEALDRGTLSPWDLHHWCPHLGA